MYILYEVVGHL